MNHPTIADEPHRLDVTTREMQVDRGVESRPALARTLLELLNERVAGGR